MTVRLRRLAAAAALLILVACGGPPAGGAATGAPEPSAGLPAAPSPAALPSERPEAVATPSLPATGQVVELPSATPVSPTAPPAAEPAPGPPPISPIPAAAFPSAEIDESTLPLLRPIGSVGLGGALHAAIAPDKRVVAVATTAGLALFELPSLRLIHFEPIAEGAHRVDFGDDGLTLAVTTGTFFDPRRIERRSVADGSLLGSSPAAFQEKAITIFSPAGDVRANLNVPDSVPTPGVVITRVADDRVIYADDVTERVAFSRDGALAVLVTYTGAVRLLDLQAGATSDLHLPPIWSVAFSPDGQTFAAAGRAVWLWSVLDGAPLQTLDDLAVAGERGIVGAAQRVSYSGDGAVLTVDGEYYVFEAGLRRATAWHTGGAGLAHAWDVDAGGSGLGNFTTYVGAISPATDAVAWTDDGVTLELHGGGQLQRTIAVPGAVGALAFSADGERLAIADRLGVIQVVRADDGSPVQELEAAGAVGAVVWSPDGALLAARAGDTIAVWRLGEREPLARIAGAARSGGPEPEALRSDRFAFTTGERFLVAWGQAGVRFYRLPDGQLVHTIAAPADDVAIGPLRRLLAILHNGRVELWGVP